MRGPASAYEALGLEPGADREAVERAYRRLIKLHHPDRSGGDARKAAEINRAYFELRRRDDAHTDAPETGRREAPRRSGQARGGSSRRGRSRRRQRVWPLLPLALAVWAMIERERLAEQVPAWIGGLADGGPTRSPVGGPAALRLDADVIDGPLNEAVIVEAADEAVRLAGTGGEPALVRHSRNCHRQLRLRPELTQLDRCSAFDDAVAVLADEMRLDDRVTFSASAVAARQMTGASLLSTDYLANERRLDRIRARVELILLPRPEPLPLVRPGGDGASGGRVDPEAVLESL